MYVLMDMEWVDNPEGKLYPSQLAAMRIDSNWETVQLFSMRIQPADESFHIWDHVGYTGGYANEFLSAPPAREVFKMLRQWLQPEDVLCWWRGHGLDLFGEHAVGIDQKQLVLQPYVREYLRESDLYASPYRMLDRLGITQCGISNHAKSDVKTMAAALKAVRFPQSLLQQDAQALELSDADCFLAAYVEELDMGIVHKLGCGKVGNGEVRQHYSMQGIYKKKLKPCPCCAEEYRQEKKRKNKGSIDRSEYAFVYAPGSGVFHKRSCPVILHANDILGTVHYASCIKTGRRPCLTCKPSRHDETMAYVKPQVQEKKPRLPVVLPPKPAPKPKRKLPFFANRGVTEQEERALRRLKQAKEDRERLLRNDSLTPQQREDAIVLTQPGFGFWSAAGYGSFHLRHCGKLNSLTDLRGYALYEDAVRAGYQPCKQCKPTAKHNIEISLPIYSREREGETLEMLETLCRTAGFQCATEKDVLITETPMGIWRIHTNEIPCRLEHFSKGKSRIVDGVPQYHRQPRIFLSLRDAFTYIKHHDTPEPETREEAQARLCEA